MTLSQTKLNLPRSNPFWPGFFFSDSSAFKRPITAGPYYDDRDSWGPHILQRLDRSLGARGTAPRRGFPLPAPRRPTYNFRGDVQFQHPRWPKPHGSKPRSYRGIAGLCFSCRRC
jgi:hypothetical protein